MHSPSELSVLALEGLRPVRATAGRRGAAADTRPSLRSRCLSVVFPVSWSPAVPLVHRVGLRSYSSRPIRVVSSPPVIVVTSDETVQLL